MKILSRIYNANIIIGLLLMFVITGLTLSNYNSQQTVHFIIAVILELGIIAFLFTMLTKTNSKIKQYLGSIAFLSWIV